MNTSASVSIDMRVTTSSEFETTLHLAPAGDDAAEVQEMPGRVMPLTTSVITPGFSVFVAI